MSTQPVLNQDPIDIVTWRVLPSGEVEALLRLSERDMALVEDRGARYSIEPNQPMYPNGFLGMSLNPVVVEMPGLLDGGPVGEAAEEGKDIERTVTARLPVPFFQKHRPPSDEEARALYETQPPPPIRCGAWVTSGEVRMRCDLVEGHAGTRHEYAKVWE